MMHSKGPRTFGEALIVAVALGGFLALYAMDKVTFDDIGGFASVLAVALAFYALLLLVRAIFTFMTGGESFWWEKYEERDRKMSMKK